MSESKDSFVVYTDIKEILDDLDDNQVAQLFRGMVDYRITGKLPKFTGTLKYVFVPIRQQMDRDREKWELKREARAAAGRKGGIASGESRRGKNEANKANEANASSAKPSIPTASRNVENSNEANEAVNVTAPVTVTDTVTATVTTTTTGGRGADDDDSFDIWKLLTPEKVDEIYDVYPESGGFLIQEVYEDVKAKKKTVKNPVAYILGYAKNVGWDDNADHFNAPWEEMS